jgi:6-phosphogluconolactonase
MQFITYPDAELMMMRLADELAGLLRQTLDMNPRASLAVPGGTTPGPVFDVLSALTLDWDRVDVMLTDERWVPETSLRSNTALLKHRLLTGPAAAARLIPLCDADRTPEDALGDLSAAVTACLPLSICLLGMGTDMHTASIFPGADRLDEALTGDSPLVPMLAPGAPEPRITLSARVLNGAMHRHLLIIGQDKRDALERARHLPPQDAPVAAILPGTTVHWAKD